MGRMDVNGSARFGVNPRLFGTAAGKYQGVKFAPGQDGQTHLPVGGDVGNRMDRLPHVVLLASNEIPALI